MRYSVKLMAAMSICAAAPAQAALASFDFRCISTGVAGACAVGQSQFAVDVTDVFFGALAGQVLFTFRNTGLQSRLYLSANFLLLQKKDRHHTEEIQ